MILDEIVAEVSAQLDTQAGLGVRIEQRSDIPDSGPTNRGLWFQIPNVTAVFADLKDSTKLGATSGPRVAAVAYTYFIRAMAVIFDRFSARYVDIQGDGIFGLFSGKGAPFLAAASAITMRTQMERDVATRFKQDASSSWELTAGIGIDEGTLLVRRLGLRGTKLNEVWSGNPVNMAAKLSSFGGSNQILVSERAFARYQRGSELRQRALVASCGCNWFSQGRGLDTPKYELRCPWSQESAPRNLGLDFQNVYRLMDGWCPKHGPEYCETIVSGKRPSA